MTTDADPSDTPLALLVGLDQSERVLALLQLPPVHEILVPATVKTRVHVDDLSVGRPPHRVFRLSPHLRSRSHRWWEVYNEGRSRTPQDGFVYLEVAVADTKTVDHSL